MSLASLSIAVEYRTGDFDPGEYFYPPVLAVANRYDRAVGYFRSTFLLVVGPSLIDFVKRGGRIRLICSPELSVEDIKALDAGYALRDEIVTTAISRDIDLAILDTQTKERLELLATLVAINSLDIRVAIREPRQGLYHEKLGIFVDSDENVVSFKGSMNETFSGMHPDGNFESIEVFCSFWGGTDLARTQRHVDYFESLWSNRVRGVNVIEFPDALKRKLLTSAKPSLDDFISDDKGISNFPKRVLLPHQVEAVRNWKAAGERGIFEHATGSGKTVTALAIIAEHMKSHRPAIVLVPSQLLLKQWQTEITSEMPAVKVLFAGAGNNIWRDNPEALASFTDNMMSLGPRIVLATMHTATTDVFRNRLRDGNHLLFVADEVHQIGSQEFSKLLTINAGSRLGLSATPERYGDPDGTRKIFDYFGGIIPPKITLKDALEAGRLVPYRYYPHPVLLTPEEELAWNTISKQLAREYAIANSSGGARKIKNTERIKQLLIKRSRFAKKATGKIPLALRILSEEYRPDSRWLIYCDDSHQVNSLVASLTSDGMSPIVYHSGMTSDAKAALSHFRDFGGILVSIRCLDEGIDIPSITHALILASSQNPRQFIQRRGRVLRANPGKYEAVIHDALIRPLHIDSNPYQMNYFKAELKRAIEFAGAAANPACITELMHIATEVGLNPIEIVPEEFEEPDEY